MRKNLFLRIGATAVLGLLLAFGLTSVRFDTANAEDKDPPAKAKVPAPAAKAPELLPMPEDPAFDRYVDLQLLGLAVGNLDPAGLTDAGLLMAEGERVLQRPHKNGLTAQHVLKKAATLAAMKHDKTTLDRLARASEKLGDKELVSHVAAARKLADSPREIHRTLHVSVAEISPDTFSLLKGLHNQLTLAQLLGDPEELIELKQRLGASKDLPATHREVLKQQLARATEGLPKTQTAADLALRKLSASSRWWNPAQHWHVDPISIPPVRIPNPVRRWFPHPGYTGYLTNKFALMNGVENGGWAVAWSSDISETDAINGLLAAGVSVWSANPAPFYEWIENLVDRTIDSLETSAEREFPAYIKGQVRVLAAGIIRSAIQGKSPQYIFRSFDTVDIKAGAIRYTGGNYADGRLVSPHTWGMKPFIALRWR